MITPLPLAPRSIADANGQPRIGAYQGAVSEVDLSLLKGDYQPRCLDRFIRDKEFTYTAVSGVSDEGRRVKVVMAIADLGYASTGFVTVFDIDQKKVLADQSFFGGASISPQPMEGLQASFNGWGHHARLSLSHPRGAQSYSQHIDVAAKGDQPAIAFDGVFGKGGPPPATVIAPMIRDGEDRPTATEISVKSQALPGSGTLNVGGETFRLGNLLAAIDYSSGTMNRVTEWRWGSATGQLNDGRNFGLNLGEGFNDSDPRANANMLWVTGPDGKSEIHSLPRLKFDFDPAQPMNPWRVTAAEEGNFEVDLSFEPIGLHSSHMNLGIIKSDFDQPSGLWRGKLVNKDTGEIFEFQGADGEAEDQHVKW